MNLKTRALAVTLSGVEYQLVNLGSTNRANRTTHQKTDLPDQKADAHTNSRNTTYNFCFENTKSSYPS
jgi:hypothetical protein